MMRHKMKMGVVIGFMVGLIAASAINVARALPTAPAITATLHPATYDAATVDQTYTNYRFVAENIPVRDPNYLPPPRAYTNIAQYKQWLADEINAFANNVADPNMPQNIRDGSAKAVDALSYVADLAAQMGL